MEKHHAKCEAMEHALNKTISPTEDDKSFEGLENMEETFRFE